MKISYTFLIIYHWIGKTEYITRDILIGLTNLLTGHCLYSSWVMGSPLVQKFPITTSLVIKISLPGSLVADQFTSQADCSIMSPSNAISDL